MDEQMVQAALAAGARAADVFGGADETYVVEFEYASPHGMTAFRGSYYRFGDVVWTVSEITGEELRALAHTHPDSCPCGSPDTSAALARRIAEVRALHMLAVQVASLSGDTIGPMAVMHTVADPIRNSVFAGTTIPDGMSAS